MSAGKAIRYSVDIALKKWKILQNFGEQTMCVIGDEEIVDFPVSPTYGGSPSPPTVQLEQEPQEPGYRSSLLVVSSWFRFALAHREISSSFNFNFSPVA